MKRTPWTLAVVYLCAGFVVLTLIWAIVVIYGNSRVNRETLDTIKSCTTPGKPCFDRGQARTGEAVAGINESAWAAAACADKPRRQTFEQIKRCVEKKLAEGSDR